MTDTTHHVPRQRIAYVGNFRPEHSTENHVAETLRRMGHDVHQLQEDDHNSWHWLLGSVDLAALDLVLWTRTGWDPPVPHDMQLAALDRCATHLVPTVGFHLDRWWDLGREGQVATEPFFRCSLVITADGDHDDEWVAAGVNHLWMPPAVAEWQMGWGTKRDRFACDVAFVGSWASYHEQWPWRTRMVRLLRNRYGARRFQAFPLRGEAIRGDHLRDLYASATVIIGDSCLVDRADGRPVEQYWSDRVPETLGRGGLLVHPYTESLVHEYAIDGTVPLVTFDRQDATTMYDAIDAALAMPVAEQYAIRRNGMAVVAADHTYRHRMEQMLTAVTAGVTA